MRKISILCLFCLMLSAMATKLNAQGLNVKHGSISLLCLSVIAENHEIIPTPAGELDMLQILVTGIDQDNGDTVSQLAVVPFAQADALLKARMPAFIEIKEVILLKTKNGYTYGEPTADDREKNKDKIIFIVGSWGYYKGFAKDYSEEIFKKYFASNLENRIKWIAYPLGKKKPMYLIVGSIKSKQTDKYESHLLYLEKNEWNDRLFKEGRSILIEAYPVVFKKGFWISVNQLNEKEKPKALILEKIYNFGVYLL